MPLATGLRVNLYSSDLSSPMFLEDLTERLSALSFTTALHGGFKELKGEIAMGLADAWPWLSEVDKLPGRFFTRIVVTREQDIIWEGRVMEITLQSGGLTLTQSAMDLRNAIIPVVGGTEGTTQTNTTSLSLYPRRELLLQLPTGTNANTQADAAQLTAAERGNPNQAQTFQHGGGTNRDGIRFVALGYWSALRDQYYDAADGGNTDWTAGGPHTVDDIFKEMLTGECPDISSDQSNIGANSRDVVGIDLTDRDYPQNHLVIRLAPLSDDDQSIWHAAIWGGRIPYWTKRAIADIDWELFQREGKKVFEAKSDRLLEKPQYYMRAGDVVRIQDMVPASVPTPSFDALRTFYVYETRYDAVTDIMVIAPDRPKRSLSALLARANQVERNY